MRRFALTFLVLPLVGTVNAEEPGLLIERAVKAMGGVEAVKQPVAVRMKTKGKFYFGDDKPMDAASLEGEYYHWGKRSKLLLDTRIGDAKYRLNIVTDGEKWWVKADDQVMTVNPQESDSLQASRYVDRVAGLTDLLTDKGFTLSALPDAKVLGHPTHVVKVSYKGQPDTSLYFDAKTGLLVKYLYRTKFFTDTSTKEMEVLHETYLSDYREPDLTSADEQVLREAKIGVAGPDLLAFLRSKTASPEQLAEAHTLIRQLGDDTFRIRERASKKLVALGSMALPLLREAVNDSDREVARRARECLQQIGEEKSKAQITAAIRLLGVRRPSNTTEVLLNYLPGADNDAAREVRAVLFALAQKDGKANPVLVRALDDKEPIRRQAAMAALGTDGGTYARQPGRRIFGPLHKIAMKSRSWTDGKKDSDLEMYDFQFFNAFEDKMFTRP